MIVQYIPKKKNVNFNTGVLFVTNDNPAKVYLYNPNTKESTLLSVPNITGLSGDIAHTSNKMWLYGGVGVKEWNLSNNPLSATYNREISNIFGTNGLGAISDTRIINGAYMEMDITTNTATLVKALSNGFPTRTISGDVILTTDSKFIVTFRNNSFSQFWITQYNYTGSSLVLELDIDITSQITAPWGLFEHNNKIYIANGDGKIYNIDVYSPYGISLFDDTGYIINGASQIPSLLNTSFVV